MRWERCRSRERRDPPGSGADSRGEGACRDRRRWRLGLGGERVRLQRDQDRSRHRPGHGDDRPWLSAAHRCCWGSGGLGSCRSYRLWQPPRALGSGRDRSQDKPSIGADEAALRAGLRALPRSRVWRRARSHGLWRSMETGPSWSRAHSLAGGAPSAGRDLLRPGDGYRLVRERRLPWKHRSARSRDPATRYPGNQLAPGEPGGPGCNPVWIARGGDYLWVTNSDDRSITVIPAVSLSAVGTVPLDGRPVGLASGVDQVWVAVDLR